MHKETSHRGDELKALGWTAQDVSRYVELWEYRQRWGLTTDRVQRLPAHGVVLHPAPMNRGVEIDDGVADGPRSVIFDQMENGVFARMAVLLHCMEAD